MNNLKKYMDFVKKLSMRLSLDCELNSFETEEDNITETFSILGTVNKNGIKDSVIFNKLREGDNVAFNLELIVNSNCYMFSVDKAGNILKLSKIKLEFNDNLNCILNVPNTLRNIKYETFKRAANNFFKRNETIPLETVA